MTRHTGDVHLKLCSPSSKRDGQRREKRDSWCLCRLTWDLMASTGQRSQRLPSHDGLCVASRSAAAWPANLIKALQSLAAAAKEAVLPSKELVYLELMNASASKPLWTFNEPSRTQPAGNESERSGQRLGGGLTWNGIDYWLYWERGVCAFRSERGRGVLRMKKMPQVHVVNSLTGLASHRLVLLFVQGAHLKDLCDSMLPITTENDFLKCGVGGGVAMGTNVLAWDWHDWS